jgi:hypothetical protein
MAYTQQQLNDLDAAIAEGVLVVQSNGRRVEYRSLDEMIRTRNLIASQIGGGSTVPVTRRYAGFRRD